VEDFSLQNDLVLRPAKKKKEQTYLDVAAQWLPMMAS